MEFVNDTLFSLEDMYNPYPVYTVYILKDVNDTYAVYSAYFGGSVQYVQACTVFNRGCLRSIQSLHIVHSGPCEQSVRSVHSGGLYNPFTPTLCDLEEVYNR